jgi:hypothetical protein
MAETENKAIYDKGPSVHDGEIHHSDMAEAILRVRSFLTYPIQNKYFCMTIRQAYISLMVKRLSNN